MERLTKIPARWWVVVLVVEGVLAWAVAHIRG